MPAFTKQVPETFGGPISLPQTPEQAAEWQEVNRSWWERNPMRYDWKEGLGYEEFSPRFYEEIDKRFFSDAKQYLEWVKTPFESLIDFPSLATADVLEIGVGSGSHAELLARHAKSYTGIDLTEYAVKSTTKRLELRRLPASVQRMDAEKMSFPDASFDYVWSWGVIHHSANTRQILSEIRRVLRPGGRAVTMVYHRNFYNYYFVGGLLHGLVQGELFKAQSLHRTVQWWTDGGLARYYTIPEWRALCSEFLEVDKIRVFGNKSQLVPLPGGKFKNAVMSLVPNTMSRFVQNTCRLGHFLVSWQHKPA